MMKKTYIIMFALSFIMLGGLSVYAQNDKSTQADEEKPLFEVKNDAGKTVFAVYPGGVKIFVDDKAKASGGGFTIQRLSTGKATEEPIFSVNKNDVKVTIDNQAKASGGGFTIQRLSTGKATEQPIFSVNDNDVKVTIDDKAKASGGGFTIQRLSTGKATEKPILSVNPNDVKVTIDNQAKASGGGFTIQRLSTGKATEEPIFSVNPNDVKVTIDDKAKASGGGFTIQRLSTGKATQKPILSVQSNQVDVLLDDTKSKASGGGFTIQRLSTGKASDEQRYFQVTPDSTRVYAKTNDNNKSAFAVGTIQATTTGAPPTPGAAINLTPVNYYIGHGVANPKLTLSTVDFDDKKPYHNTIIGFGAGHKITSANNNVLIGYEAGLNIDKATNNIYIGNNSGKGRTGGSNNIIIGNNAGKNSVGTTTGENNIFIGNYAGINFEKLDVSSKLVISSPVENPNGGLPPLIVGDFAQQTLLINGSLSVKNTLTVQGEVVQPSDQRLKTNFQPITTGLNIVKSLAAYYFDWKDDAKAKYGFSDEHQIGLMAQDVEKVLPEAVSNNAIGGYKGIAYTKLIPVLLSAIKEQNKIIEQLQADVKELKKKQ